jgi:hypothetical protein
MKRKLKWREKEAISAVGSFFTVMIPLQIINVLLATRDFSKIPQFANIPKLHLFLALCIAMKWALAIAIFGGPLLMGAIIYFLAEIVSKNNPKLKDSDKSI